MILIIRPISFSRLQGYGPIYKLDQRDEIGIVITLSNLKTL